MAEMLVSFIQGDKISPDTDYRDNLSVNMSAIYRPIFGAKGYLLQDYGLTEHATTPGIDRGGIWNDKFENHFRVSGDQLISVDEDGNTVNLGLVTGSKTASLPYSFNTQAIITNNKMFLYDTTNGLIEVRDSDLGNPIDGVWVDGYYFLTDGEFIYHTNIADESSIDPLKFATAEFMPDKTWGVAKTQDNKVMVFGRYSIEYFVNAATEQFAFQRLPTRAIKIGIVGTHCKTESGGAWFILGGRKEESIGVHVVTVGSSQKISSREVDIIIGQYTEEELSTAVIESRSEDDSNYIIIHLPDTVLKFNKDVAAVLGSVAAWSLKKSGTDDAPWSAKHGVYDPRLSVWIYGDKIRSKLAILDETVATHYGEIAEWLLYTPFIYLESKSIDEIVIDTIPGHTGSDDAVVAISLSYDGLTFGKEWFNLYGLPNDYNQRFEIKRLGQVRNWVGIKMRGTSLSRMAFSRARLRYG